MGSVQPRDPIADAASASGKQAESDPFKKLLKEELRRIANRRNAVERDGTDSPEETVGLALSGGGIRSATLSLGVLQSLARRDLLKNIDYLSTVSGGGYAGCYLGSFFLPKELRQAETLEVSEIKCRERCEEAYKELREAATLTAPPSACAGVRSMLVEGSAKKEGPGAEDKKWSADAAFDWVRNNGRYLAPRGAGDLIYAVAMQIRNWAAVQYVIGVMIMFLLVAFSFFRAWLIAKIEWWREIEVYFLPGTGDWIYWSPGWTLVGIFALVGLVPPALAYWLAHARIDEKRKLSWLPLWHEGVIIFLLLLGLTWAYIVLVVLPTDGALMSPFDDKPQVFWTAMGYVVVSLLSMGTFLAGLDIECRSVNAFRLHFAQVAVVSALAVRGAFVDGVNLKRTLFAAAFAVAVWLIISVGKPFERPPDPKTLRTRFTRWLGSTFWVFLGAAGLALLGTIGQTVYAYVRLEPGAADIAGYVSVVGGIVIGARQLFKWLGSGSKQAHPKIPLDALAGSAAVLLVLLTGGAYATLVQAALWKGGPPPAVPRIVQPETLGLASCPQRCAHTWVRADSIDVSPWKTGTDSQMVALDKYGTRVEGQVVTISPGWMTVLLIGVAFLFVTTGLFLNFVNMSSLHQFYAARLARAYLGATNRERFEKGGVRAVTTPLATDTIRLEAYYHEHLRAPVHLINVTVNQTRPSEAQLVQRDRKGLSMVIGPKYTIVNSAIFERQESTGNLATMNEPSIALAGGPADEKHPLHSEELDLGDWCAISGAAFSTGLGMRTSLGLSLLAGLANVRLGYWWNFNVDHPGLDWPASLVPPAYRYLWAELMADFKGPWKPFWFLTDGGHFDNTAVYELVRRRVGTILLCDNGCDPDFRFDDLGNLARKIRSDFDAEMRPIAPAWGLTRYFASPEDFAHPKRRKGKCALLYEVSYPRTDTTLPPSRGSLLIVLKPNMISGVPIDVMDYDAVNPEFPHQSTLDQFFDDAQWESYRKLGDVIATAVIEPEALAVDGWRKTLLSGA